MKERRQDYPDILDRLQGIENELKKLDEAISGNGEPGLKERMNSVERFVIELRDFHKVIVRTLIGCTGTIVSSIVIAMIIYFMIPK